MASVLIALSAGLFLGVIAGLVPGVHPNVFASLAFTLSLGTPFDTSILLISAAVANSFVSFIPSIFLGAPDGGTELSVLPGHSLVMEGRGYEAVRLTVMGGLGAVALSLVLLPVASHVMPVAYTAVRPHIHLVLSGVLVYSFLTDRSPWTVVVTVLSGTLGILALDGIANPLFPMLTGLFGVSSLLYSLNTMAELPLQTFSFERRGAFQIIRGSGIGYVAGLMVGLLPGVGASHATYLAGEGSNDVRDFMMSIGGVTTADAVFSVLALWLIGNPRSGVAVAVGNLTGGVFISDVIAFVGVIAASAGVVSIVTLLLASRLANSFRNVDYRRLTAATIVLLVALVMLLSGVEGVLLMVLSTAIGLVAITSGIRRSYLMGALLVPTIVFFSGF